MIRRPFDSNLECHLYKLNYQKTEGDECPNTQMVKQWSVMFPPCRLLNSEDVIQAEHAFC